MDIAADAILELAGIATPSATPLLHEDDLFLTRNLLNPKTFSWTKDLLPALRSAGLEFDSVPPDEWLEKLRESAGKIDAKDNPAIKLIEYFEKTYGGTETRDKLDFSTRQAEQDSSTLQNAPDLLKDGYIKKFVET